jgi:hypothetical protein
VIDLSHAALLLDARPCRLLLALLASCTPKTRQNVKRCMLICCLKHSPAGCCWQVLQAEHPTVDSLSKDASMALTCSGCAESEIAQNAALGVEPGQRTLDSFAVDEPRAADALEELAMFFYTSNTPPERVNNPHLNAALRCLASKHHSGKICGAATCIQPAAKCKLPP